MASDLTHRAHPRQQQHPNPSVMYWENGTDAIDITIHDDEATAINNPIQVIQIMVGFSATTGAGVGNITGTVGMTVGSVEYLAPLFTAVSAASTDGVTIKIDPPVIVPINEDVKIAFGGGATGDAWKVVVEYEILPN